MTNKSSLNWVIKSTKASLAKVLMLTLYQSMVSVCVVVFALIMRRAIDAAVGSDRASFIHYALVLIAIVVIQIVLRACIRWTTEVVKADTENVLKRKVYSSILSRSYSALSVFHTGELQNRLTNDTVVISDGIASIFPNTIAMLVKIIGATAVLLALDWKFAIIFIISGILLIIITYFFRSKLKVLHKKVQEADGSVRSFLQESTGNLLMIKSFSGEEKTEFIASGLMDNHKKERLKRSFFSVICNIGFGAVMRGGYLFGLFWCGFGIINGTISYGTLAAVLQLVGQIQSPAANMTGYIPKYYAMLASAERLIELEELSADEVESQLSYDDAKDFYNSLSSISAYQMTFSYPEDDLEPVLEDASIRINKGEFVAITGETGIGKSTLLKLLLAVYEPDKGELVLESAKGERTKISPATRRMFAYVPQGLFLMSGSLWDAVSLFSEGSVDKRRAAEACNIACLDFIDDLPNGMDTIIGERGEGLSEGQRQRIAIARALYSGAPVLLLDEATSALDETTEKELLQNLRRLTDKTVIIVTHRKAALEYCDRTYNIREKQFFEI